MYTIVVVVLEFETNNKYDILNVLGQPIYHMFEGANLKYNHVSCAESANKK